MLFVLLVLAIPRAQAQEATTPPGSAAQTSPDQTPANSQTVSAPTQGGAETPAQRTQTPTNPQTDTAPAQSEAETPAQAPEMAPVTSSVTLLPGLQGSKGSYLLPSIQYTAFLSRAATQTAGPGNNFASSTFIGDLVLQQVRPSSEINLGYAVGAAFYDTPLINGTNGPQSTYGFLHQLNFTGIKTFRHLKVTLNDSFAYLPEAAYGFSGFSGLQSFGGGSGGNFLGNNVSVNPELLSSQSAITGFSRRYSGSSIAEIDYSPGSGRSTLTLTGAYGLLHFVDPGFIDNHYWTFIGGYNYRVSRSNEIGIIYIHDLLGFKAQGEGILVRGLGLNYGHRLTRNLSVIFSVEPVADEILQPGGHPVTKVFYGTNDSLAYRSRKIDLEARYFRYTSSGAGLLYGARSDNTELTFGRQITRRSHGGLEFGHVFSQALLPPSSGQPASQFETWEAGANLSREVGEHASIYANYQFQRQAANRVECFGNACGITYLRYIVGFGLNWHGRPIRIH
ncbi:MAG: hypothetical protein ACYDA9_03150 [Terriglobia bacterium]